MGLNIIKQLQQHLATSLNVEIQSYIDKVNSFPAISITENSRERRHFGGESHIIFDLKLRGYTHSSIETSLDDTELFARELELAVQTFVRVTAINTLTSASIITTQSGLELSTQSLIQLATQNSISIVEDCRVLTISTDEGLLAPYGVCDLEIGATYVSYS